MCFWKELVASSKKASENESRHSELPSSANLEANIYSFGVVLLEIISGRPPYRPEQGHLIDWVHTHTHIVSPIFIYVHIH